MANLQAWTLPQGLTHYMGPVIRAYNMQ